MQFPRSPEEYESRQEERWSLLRFQRFDFFALGSVALAVALMMGCMQWHRSKRLRDQKRMEVGFLVFTVAGLVAGVAWSLKLYREKVSRPTLWDRAAGHLSEKPWARGMAFLAALAAVGFMLTAYQGRRGGGEGANFMEKNFHCGYRFVNHGFVAKLVASQVRVGTLRDQAWPKCQLNVAK